MRGNEQEEVQRKPGQRAEPGAEAEAGTTGQGQKQRHREGEGEGEGRKRRVGLWVVGGGWCGLCGLDGLDWMVGERGREKEWMRMRMGRRETKRET